MEGAARGGVGSWSEWELGGGGGRVEVGGGPPARRRARCEMAQDNGQAEIARGACQGGSGGRVVFTTAQSRVRRVCCHSGVRVRGVFLRMSTIVSSQGIPRITAAASAGHTAVGAHHRRAGLRSCTPIDRREHG